MKEGAFDFLLSVAADVKPPDWQDPTRVGVQQWLQRQSPAMPSEAVAFSDDFQTRVQEQLETFIDAFISNQPDVLRRLRIEEDEQRQLSQAHEQSLDLERFLLIIAFAFEGRDEAGSRFWVDPDSNLSGFLHWASRRASTPLVSAFCEMLQAITGDDRNADAAHAFLGEDGPHGSGKMRRTQPLTWNQIFKELDFFTNKIRDRTNSSQSQTYRAGKPSTEQSETEPESAIMLECYLRLITKLSANSKSARSHLLKNGSYNLVPVLLTLGSLPVPRRLRACVFYTLKALLTGKDKRDGDIMWSLVDGFLAGAFVPATQVRTGSAPNAGPGPANLLGNILDEVSYGFEEPNAFIQLILSLIVPPVPQEADPLLVGALPFPENMGISTRMPGMMSYVDFVLGTAFLKTSTDVPDAQQLRILRLSCLEFALTCLEAFDENLILIGNETNIAVDSAIATTDLATYVRLHPFARVMEWMLNTKVVESIFQTIHQDPIETGSALPDSPLILSIIRAVEVMIQILERQGTYLDLVRQIVGPRAGQRPSSNAIHSTYTCFEEGIMNHLDFVVDLGRCCGLGHPALTLGCLKLLEKISASSRILSAWNPATGQPSHRNKAIVALESGNAAEAIAGSFMSEIAAPLDPLQEAESPNYLIKAYILNFLGACLQASPDQPSMAHLLLGFRCGINALSIETGSSFDDRSSLFHRLLKLLIETPFEDEAGGMRYWLIALKHKVMRIFGILWNSPMSSAIVLADLRENDLLFHLLVRDVTLTVDQQWDGEFLVDGAALEQDAVLTLIEYLGVRGSTLEYVSRELCSVAQNRLPNLKRRIFEALNGRILGEDGDLITTPGVFDLLDFTTVGADWAVGLPEISYYKDLDPRSCVEEDAESKPMFNIDRVQEIFRLKREEDRKSRGSASESQQLAINLEEQDLVVYMQLSNRQRQLEFNRQKASHHGRTSSSSWSSPTTSEAAPRSRSSFRPCKSYFLAWTNTARTSRARPSSWPSWPKSYYSS